MELISRKTALKDSKFASFIHYWQNISNPENDGDPLDPDFKEELMEFQKIIDNAPEVTADPVGTIVIDAPEDAEEIVYLTNVLVHLLGSFDLEFIFIPLFKTSWFQERIEDHHRDTKESYRKLKSIIGFDDYDGGVIISNAEELQTFLPHYFTLIQGNYFGYNFFYSERLQTVCSFHYTGQIWFYSFLEDSLKKIESFIEQKELIINNRFSSRVNS